MTSQSYSADQTTSSLPQDGSTIVFSVVPTGSYCRPNEAYRVKREGKYFHFTSVARGSSTSDQVWAVKRSKWTNR